MIKTLSEMAPLDFKRIADQVKENRRVIDSNPRGIGFLQWPDRGYVGKPITKKVKR